MAVSTMTYEDAMDDVHTRFLLNLPADEFASADRIFFQIEQAWYVTRF
jgi:mRNA-decapping enzyme subunit 2